MVHFWDIFCLSREWCRTFTCWKYLHHENTPCAATWNRFQRPIHQMYVSSEPLMRTSGCRWCQAFNLQHRSRWWTFSTPADWQAPGQNPLLFTQTVVLVNVQIYVDVFIFNYVWLDVMLAYHHDQRMPKIRRLVALQHVALCWEFRKCLMKFR